MVNLSRWKRALVASAWGVLLAFPVCVRATVTVPDNWNVAPLASGGYLESFDSTLPAWANVGSTVVTNVFDMTGAAFPTRTNAWFGSNSKVLQLDTGSALITNAVVNQSGQGVTYTNDPVYVDMRIKFNAMSEAPAAEQLENAKMGIFVSSESKLVAIYNGGWVTNSTVLNTNLWYQLTIRMSSTGFDVLLNDNTVFVNLGLKNSGPANTMQAACFSGLGQIDNLYISHCDPMYPVLGALTSIPTLPPVGANPPTPEQQTRINTWLSTYLDSPSSITLGEMTQDELSRCYLLGELGGDSTTAAAVAYTFGISGLDVISPTTLRVTIKLTTDNRLKTGKINGRIQLLGKANIDDGWTMLDGSITPEAPDFENGYATYTYTIPAGGYRFFRPQIIP